MYPFTGRNRSHGKLLSSHGYTPFLLWEGPGQWRRARGEEHGADSENGFAPSPKPPAPCIFSSCPSLSYLFLLFCLLKILIIYLHFPIAIIGLLNSSIFFNHGYIFLACSVFSGFVLNQFISFAGSII